MDWKIAISSTINNRCPPSKKGINNTHTTTTPTHLLLLQDEHLVVMVKNILFLVLLSVALVSATPSWGQPARTAAIHHPSRRSSTLLASRKKKNQVLEIPEEPTPSPLANAVIGGVVIIGTTAVEYASGFIGGYFLGTLVGIPGIVYSKEGLSMAKRFANMNARSMGWAKTWAPISAVFGGCDAATRVVRGNVHDQWNTVISSAAAGAYFSRQGM